MLIVTQLLTLTEGGFSCFFSFRVLVVTRSLTLLEDGVSRFRLSLIVPSYNWVYAYLAYPIVLDLS